jgi:hypothetical protein
LLLLGDGEELEELFFFIADHLLDSFHV